MKRFTLVAAALAIFGCGRVPDSKEAVRQGVMDYVASRANLGAMEVDVTSVDFKGSEADAMVAFRAKGADPSSGIQMKYRMEKRSGKWVVKEKSESGGGHGAAAAPHGATGGDLPAGHPPVPAGEAGK